MPCVISCLFSCNLAINSLLVNNCNLRRVEFFLHILWLLNSQILLFSLFSCLTGPPLLPYTLAYSENLSNSVYSLHSHYTRSLINHIPIISSQFFQSNEISISFHRYAIAKHGVVMMSQVIKNPPSISPKLIDLEIPNFLTIFIRETPQDFVATRRRRSFPVCVDVS